MKGNVNRLLSIITMLVVAGMPTTSAIADGNCDREPTRHKLTVQVKYKKPKKLYKTNYSSADTILVCLGDTVEWKLKGSSRAFAVDFGGQAPFEGDKRRNSANHKIEVEITAGDPGQSFKYSVWIGDNELDPRIVIDR